MVTFDALSHVMTWSRCFALYLGGWTVRPPLFGMGLPTFFQAAASAPRAPRRTETERLAVSGSAVRTVGQVLLLVELGRVPLATFRSLQSGGLELGGSHPLATQKAVPCRVALFVRGVVDGSADVEDTLQAGVLALLQLQPDGDGMEQPSLF